MPFQIIRNDITKVEADAIVNTANPHSQIGSGADRAIYQAAGKEQLLEARRKIGDIPVGEVAVTDAFSLSARYIIHTVGPSWTDGRHGEFSQLASCYRKSLLIADQLGCESIAFPLISTGNYGFPKDKALQIALRTISGYLQNSDMEVLLVVFDRNAYELSSALRDEVRQYIDDNYVSQKEAEYYRRDRRREAETPVFGNYAAPDSAQGLPAAKSRKPSFFRRRGRGKKETSYHLPPEETSYTLPSEQSVRPYGESLDDAERTEYVGSAPKLEDILRHPGEGFQECLFRLIDERNMEDPEVYRKANISRKLFSKIRCSAGYTPGKRTVLALAVALELNLDQTTDLLSRAGLAFSPGSVFDLIVKYCIENRTYDIYDINALLFEYDQPLLGNAVSD